MPLLYDREVRVFMSLCGSDGNNAYLIVCPFTGESIMIDAPLNPGELLADAQGTTVKAVLVTHRHRDHWEGLEEIVAATGAQVAAHPEDADALPVPATLLVQDGETIKAGTFQIRVIHTPGHTPGSICLLTGRLLFTGDTLYAHAWGETRSAETAIQIVKSISEKLLVLPDNTVVLPGHGDLVPLVKCKQDYRQYAAMHPDILPPIPEPGPMS